MKQPKHVTAKPSRTKAYYRYQRRRAIRRKAGVLRRKYGSNGLLLWAHGQLGRLSKDKIHCSCPLCRAHFWTNPNISDQRKLEACADAKHSFFKDSLIVF